MRRGAILLTGVAGFIGQKVGELLLKKGYEVVGVDNLNDYYDVSLKKYRLNLLKPYKNFVFRKIDIENYNSLKKLFKTYKFKAVMNLAARAGVRYSIENPFVYFSTNVQG
ncbi:MAG: nucleotide sugar epimerase, partial [Candidatus Omnitrophota bacterium]